MESKYDKYNYASGAELTACVEGCGAKPVQLPNFVLTANPALKDIYNSQVASWNSCVKRCAESTSSTTQTNSGTTDRQNETAPPPSQRDPNGNGSSSKKMSTGAIIGWSIGCLVLVGGIIFLIRRNKAKNK